MLREGMGNFGQDSFRAQARTGESHEVSRQESEYVAGQVVNVPRSNGQIEEGWMILRVDPGKKVAVVYKGKLTKDVSFRQLDVFNDPEYKDVGERHDKVISKKLVQECVTEFYGKSLKEMIIKGNLNVDGVNNFVKGLEEKLNELTGKKIIHDSVMLAEKIDSLPFRLEDGREVSVDISLDNRSGGIYVYFREGRDLLSKSISN